MTWTVAAQLALHFAGSSGLCCFLQAPEATGWQLAAPVTTISHPAWARILSNVPTKDSSHSYHEEKDSSHLPIFALTCPCAGVLR